jgi:hypothetical protein
MNEESLQKVKAAVTNVPHKFVGVIPFSREITSDEPLDGNNFIPYGSTLMTMLTMDWRGNYFNPSTFRAECWNSNRADMLNLGAMSITDAVAFLKTQAPKSMWFTRPCEDLKQFSGMVIEAEECWQWFEDAMLCESSGTYHLSPDTAIVLSTPKNIGAEWRWFIVNGKVVSGSMYRFKGQMRKKEELNINVIDEAQRFADIWLPHRNCVMDIAIVDDEVKVIEFNTINSSGFYDHNVNNIIRYLYEDFVNNV